MTEPTPRYYVEYPGAEYRYRRSLTCGWTRSENPMSKWATTDNHDWDYAGLPVRIRDQYEADMAAALAIATADGINQAIGDDI